MFDFYDIKEGVLLDVDTAAGFTPLFCGAASPEQASRLYDYLNSTSFCALHQGNCFSIPNFDTQKEGFERTNYWRGPIWININWMIMQGLRRYGFLQTMTPLTAWDTAPAIFPGQRHFS
jgi:neutral trehalase